jgi:anionic cell wall polymer biosynthesis LytR-Cps2A-Psr (LCP) family protein
VRNKLLKLMVVVVLIWSICLIQGVGAAYWSADSVPRGVTYQGEAKEESLKKIVFAVVDEDRDGNRGLEGLMLITWKFNPMEAQIVSIPKNMIVAVKDSQYFSAEEMYQQYGLGHTLELAKRYFKAPKANYLVVNVEQGTKIIDKLGGVNVNVPHSVANYKPGIREMSGRELMNYSLLTDSLEDRIGWEERQRAVMDAVISKSLHPRTILKLPELIKQLGATARTDLKLTELLSLGLKIGRSGFSKLEVHFAPGRYRPINGKTLWIIDSKGLTDLVSN